MSSGSRGRRAGRRPPRLLAAVFLVRAVVLSALAAAAGSGKSAGRPAESFQPESLTYAIKWKPSLLLPAVGVGTLTVRSSPAGETFLSRTVRRTEMDADIHSVLFGVDATVHIESLFLPAGGGSLHTRALIVQNGEVRQLSIFYCPESRSLRLLELRGGAGGQAAPEVSRNEYLADTPAVLLDPAALLALLRESPLPTDFRTGLDAVYFAHIRPVTLRRESRETMKSALGEVPAVHTRLENYIGPDDERSWDIHLWSTDDDRRIPLKAKARLRMGTVEIELKKRSDGPDPGRPTAPAWLAPPAAAAPPAGPPPLSCPSLSPASGDVMVTIPGGTLAWGAGSGSAPRKPCRVSLSPFRLDRCEVTNAAYKRFVDATGHRRPDLMPFSYYRDRFHWSAGQYQELLRKAVPYRWRNGTFPPGADNLPVVLVSWEDARAYAAWASKRLPTEAEWEWAARGGLAGADFPWGNEPEPGRCATAASDFPALRPVGCQKEGDNAYGLADMAGNAGEWVEDGYDEDVSPCGETDPPAVRGKSRKVFRGGSWQHRLQDARVFSRLADYPGVTYLTVGFRCARDLP